MDYLATLAPSSLEERIVQVLASGPATRSELCARLDVSRTVLGRALAELRQDGAVRVVAYRSRREGRGPGRAHRLRRRPRCLPQQRQRHHPGPQGRGARLGADSAVLRRMAPTAG